MKTIYNIKPFVFKMNAGKLKNLYRMGFGLYDILEMLKTLKEHKNEIKYKRN